MGGPVGAYDDALHPWLGPEKQLIAEAVRAGTPFWGVCLGAQLLAASLGASVAPGPLPEVGVLPVELTAAAANDPVFAAAPASFDAFHWHGDTYELPPGAVQLARSERYEQQAFVFAERVRAAVPPRAHARARRRVRRGARIRREPGAAARRPVARRAPRAGERASSPPPSRSRARCSRAGSSASSASRPNPRRRPAPCAAAGRSRRAGWRSIVTRRSHLCPP